jgi:AraC-like DNA-binding protein
MKIPYAYTQRLIPVYLFLVGVFLLPIVCFYWWAGQGAIFMWYMLFPVGAALFCPKKKMVVIFSAYIFIMMISVVVITNVLPEDFPYFIKLSPEQYRLVNLTTIIGCFILVCYFTFFINKKIEQEQINYEELFRKINEYFKKEMPYKQFDFSVYQLATKLNTNPSYISKAINLHAKSNFNVFLNQWRINEIKQRIGEGAYEKFTIQSIYTASGFRSQSTFNKAFKAVEGITPSEYINNLKRKQKIS